jgi:hypothetical protein
VGLATGPWSRSVHGLRAHEIGFTSALCRRRTVSTTKELAHLGQPMVEDRMTASRPTQPNAKRAWLRALWGILTVAAALLPVTA